MPDGRKVALELDVGPPLFESVLVANRGEIAVRIIRTLRALGIRSIAIYSDADAEALHVRAADDAIRIGPAVPAESYLHIDRILDAAAHTDAKAVHPGYGFLSEHATFARAVHEAGLVFVGPPADVIEVMGDKIRAKATVAAAGVPVVPGRAEPGLADDALAAAAAAVGYPVLLKPSAGGGGKGMRLVHRPEDLAAALVSARREAAGAFGDDTMFVERFVTRPRHIEVQVLADAHGGIVHLGERECSLQRRHQKVIEEAPAPRFSDDQRAAIAEHALGVARACGYVNAGTVEFIVSADAPDEPYFMEMNTRLQVEHPVTELVWGVDLVAEQLAIAAGRPLSFAPSDRAPAGHAIEARIYAEDPATGFLPASGRVRALREPHGDGIRVDSALFVGGVVGTQYDPMLAKVVAHGSSRTEAVARLDAALAGTTVLGFPTNVGFLRALLADPAVVAGALDTELVARELPNLVAVDCPDDIVVAAALARLLAPAPATEATLVPAPWDTTDGWRLGPPADVGWTADRGDTVVTVTLRGVPGAPGSFEVAAHDTDARGAGASGAAVPGRSTPEVRVRVTAELRGSDLLVSTPASRDESRAYVVDRADDAVWVGRDGQAWEFVERRVGSAEAGDAATDGVVTSPMPGTVTAVQVAVGDRVEVGQPLLVVEAMKMEHTLAAPVAGTVADLAVTAGAMVARRAVLLRIEPEAASAPG